MFVVSSVLLNHEGERRGRTFVTQKIADYVGKYYDTKSFTSQVIDIKSDDILYLSSDGYGDQFGGFDDSKFKTSKF